MRVRGRYLILAWTAVFLAAAAVIVLRDLSGFALVRHLSDAHHRMAALEAMRSDYQRDIAALESRDLLGAKARALGLRVASDSELMTLRVAPHP